MIRHAAEIKVYQHGAVHQAKTGISGNGVAVYLSAVVGYDVKLAPVRDNVRIYGAGAYLGGSAACSARSVACGVRGGLTRKNACVVLRNAVYQLHSLGVGSLGIRNSGSRAALDDLGNRLCGGLFADKLLACQLAVYVLFLDGVYALAINSAVTTFSVPMARLQLSVYSVS